jgi:hypothetical protein
MLAILPVGRERSGGTTTQLEFQSQIANNFLGQQANEIRIARQSGVIIGKKFLRRGSPADVIVFLQQQNTQAGPAQITRRDKSIVPSSQNNDIVFRFNPAPAHARLNTREAPTRLRQHVRHDKGKAGHIEACPSSL